MTSGRLPGESPVRVAYVTDKSGLGGGETSLVNLLESLPTLGIEPVLMCPEGELADAAKEAKVYVSVVRFPDVHLRVGLVPTFSLRTVRDLSRRLVHESIRVMHAESLIGAYYGALAARLAGIPSVATYHGYWPLRSSIVRMFLYVFCRKVYAVSEATDHELRENLHFASRRTSTIPLGLSERFTATLPDKESARRALGFSEDRPIVMQVARFQAIKRQDLMLEAFELLLSGTNRPKPLLLFVGGVMEPADADSLRFRRAVEEKARSLELRDSVRFLGHRSDVPLLIRAADVIVTPSAFETFSMSTIEAMAVGTPVVATRVGGPAEIITHGSTGLLVPPNDANALANAIALLLADPERAQVMAGAAAASARRVYAPGVRAAALAKEYGKILARG